MKLKQSEWFNKLKSDYSYCTDEQTNKTEFALRLLLDAVMDEYQCSRNVAKLRVTSLVQVD